MKSFLYELKLFFDNIDAWRDKVLFVFIKPFWPQMISPNQLSIFRILISIFLFVLLFYYNNADRALILSLFCIGALSDMLDGSVARGLHKVTKTGIILDPIADRMLIIPIAIYSLMTSHRWLLIILLLLEVINMLVSLYTYSRHILVGANIFGKMKMVLQSVVFAGILLFWPNEPNEFLIYLLWISVYLIIISIFFKMLDLKNNGKN